MVRAYMAHHQGMSIVAIANALLDGRMRERFHSDVVGAGHASCCCRSARRAMCPWRIRAPRKSGTAARVADPAGAATCGACAARTIPRRRPTCCRTAATR